MPSAAPVAGPTPAQTIGPFFGFALPIPGGEQVVPPDAPGAVVLAGRVLDAAGLPVPDALLEIWQADAAGAFPRAPGGSEAGGDDTGGSEAGGDDTGGSEAGGDDTRGFGGFGRCPTSADGGYRFVTVKPGVVASADGRPQAPHVDLVVFARGLLKKAVTRVYFPDEPAANAADPVLASLPADRAATLVATAGPDGTLVHDVHLSGERETVFFAC